MSKCWKNRLRRGFAGSVVGVLVLSAIAPTASYANFFGRPRYREDDNPTVFEQCAQELKASGIDNTQAMSACADALVPEDLSTCVLRITETTGISPQTALSACFRVRRPVELAHCVVSIRQEVLTTPQGRQNPGNEQSLNKQGTDKSLAPDLFAQTPTLQTLGELELATLDRCRRSLLPKRYGACVVGLSREIPFVPQRILDSCIDAETYPLGN
ncbi:hypothetical protein K4A83_16160 [Spirulina subsalsa FACHB-351]|uniref:Uncharacterized protein n=1 Tax=Spirulina subsalsa FACHB-351 TaxID=234711 RepID=A0ABT3L8G9_9CYAN|nr:hypothetical protein [Spirulina subsalsa]MCW6037793.1 hypothetical protein [Spirulina subsalsa FACHB-351]